MSKNKGIHPEIRYSKNSPENFLSELEKARLSGDSLEEFLEGFSPQYQINKVVNNNNYSTLSLAIENGTNIGSISILIDQVGADVNFGGRIIYLENQTELIPPSPLLLATTTRRYDQLALVELLINRGANIDYTDENKASILVKNLLGDGDFKKNIADLLIAGQANVNLRDNNDNSAFGIVCRLARETGDQNYRDLANKIVISLYDRADRIRKHPIGGNWVKTYEEWSQNIDLLNDEVLAKIDLGKIDVENTDSEIRLKFQREILRRKNSLASTPTTDIASTNIPTISPRNITTKRLQNDSEEKNNEEEKENKKTRSR